ncbi:hypothetical protein [Variibacter gotjawalensis]|uniref:hypothetical protein n=1 Tax=Variibacter gotjawalensis TaxID=1333996 RepID=UPI0013EE61F8|nr:hypothetical protein [Variibacter gotjawalensis]NIK49701.1 hypothetical protein [Variibacter gotjawalensis]
MSLTSEQERHWPRVAAAIRSFSRDSDRVESGEAGMGEKLKHQVVGAKRVLAAAMPLIKTMTPEQKRTAAGLVRMMGYASLASRI